MSKPFNDAGIIPVNESVPTITYRAVTLEVPDRPDPLEIKVVVPETGDDLPVLLFSHGHGATSFLTSLDGYGPVTNFWAAHGFAVIQPTHLDSNTLGLRDTGRRDAPLFWHDRASDMHYILDHLDEIEAAVPGLAGRLDRDRIAIAGHSLGGSTVTSLLGMQMLDPEDDRDKDLSDPRIKVGVAIAPPGRGDDLAAWAAENYSALKHPNFSKMTGTTLVIAGGKDLNVNFSERLSYRWDAYTDSPSGNKTLLTFFGAEHMFGGISGYDAAETTDEDPERVATLRALVWAYLKTQLYPGDTAWEVALAALESDANAPAKVETR